MDTKSLRSRYNELKQQIHFHNHRYHVLDAPIISDAGFDKLLIELKRIEADHPDWITDDSPTCRGAPGLPTVSTRCATPRRLSSTEVRELLYGEHSFSHN